MCKSRTSNRGNTVELSSHCINGKILIMKPEKQKDAMSELVDIVSSDTSDSETSNEGVVTTADGDKVTLGFRGLAQKLLSAVKRKKETEKQVRDYLAKKDK